MLLNRASGVADMLFTMSANEELNQFLPNTITSSLDTLCFLIEQAKEAAIESNSKAKAEVKS